MALGGVFAPLTARGRLRQMLFLLLPLTLLLVPMGARRLAAHPAWNEMLHNLGVGMVVWLGGFGGTLAAILPLMQLNQRWQRDSAELPLLALLPGLGSHALLKRRLLQACLLPMLRVECLLLLASLGLSAALHVVGLPLALLLAQIGSTGLAIALMLCILGGRPLPGWAMAAVVAPVLALTQITLLLPAFSTGLSELPTAWPGLRNDGWLIVTLLVVALGWRGWHGYARRPHPFLANS